MPERFLMTHSLLSAWKYALKENPYENAESKTDKYADFLVTLNRIKTEPNAAMKNGIDFENLVTDIINGGGANAEWYEAADTAARILCGAKLQYTAMREADIGGTRYLLYGRLDGLKAGHIYDIKFSKSYERSKYIDSTQHPMYFELVPEAQWFSYVVSNGEYLWTETYRRDESLGIAETVAEFAAWLDMRELTQLYREKWLAL
ncbi:MAG: hypothetical protein LBJ84_00270 [Oscillospiraceae bacterium]|jgi:hypothetical protein|nr:hypothetical protein [Oscillospiraceae bacterium]